MTWRRLLPILFAAAVAILGMIYRPTIQPAIISYWRQRTFKRAMSEAARNQVIIVGSGLAGLCAAYEALNAGATVRMLDRAAKPGGNSIKASSGINGAGTRFQKAMGIEKDEVFYSDSVRSAGARFRQWEENPRGQVNREGLIRTMVERSAAAVTWLTDEVGVDLSLVAPLGGHSVARTHRGAGKTPPGFGIVSALLKKLEANENFTLTKSADVTHLRQVGGRVEGVEYNHEGHTQSLKGRVIFAAGGFAGDAHGLLARHRPDLAGLPSTNEALPGSHDILGASGAEFIDMDSVQIHPTGFVDPQGPTTMLKFLAAEVLRGEGGILLSPEGNRFVNELETREHISQRIMASSLTHQGDDNDPTSLRQWDITLLLDPGACAAADSHIGFYLFKGLMQKKKVRNLDEKTIAAIDRYADAVQVGRDQDFGRTNFGHWRLQPGASNRDEDVCIGKVTPIVHFTMGGVAFDENARVLRRVAEGLEPIPGLYAAGEITGGIHGDNRLGGSSLLECVVFGRIAGDKAARDR